MDRKEINVVDLIFHSFIELDDEISGVNLKLANRDY